MHELGVVIDVVKQVESFAAENGIKEIDTLVLQVGELCSMVPRYIEEVYPMAVEQSLLNDTKLKIEIAPGIVRCRNCDFNFNVIQNQHKCPRCRAEEWQVISGTEFIIKDIIVKES